MAVTVSSPGAIGYGAIKTDRGTTMEMHQVRYFLAVARVLNFTRAADECNVTQPSLTQAIKQLEACELIAQGGLGPTPDTSFLAAHLARARSQR